MIPWKNKALYLFILFAICELGLNSCQQNENKSDTEIIDQDEKIQNVEVVHPSTQSFEAELLITGTAMPNQIVLLHAMESGYVKAIKKDIGDHVTKGDLIALLDNPELYRLNQKLSAQLEAKKAIYDRLQKTYDQTPDLTPMQLLEESKADYIAAKTELSAVNDRQSFLHVTAPFNGVITKRLVDNGTLVQSGITNTNATAIVEIQEIDPIRLTIPLPESDASSIKEGMEAQVTFPELAGEPYTAKISRTANALDFSSKTMQVEIDLKNTEWKIKPGMYAKVQIKTSSRENVLSLPVIAQILFEDEPFVLLVKDNIVERIRLRKGLENKDYFEVLNAEIGKEAQVIIQGKGLVKPGQKVTAIEK